MKSLKITGLALMAIVLTFSACKEDDILPVETKESGFGFFVNGLSVTPDLNTEYVVLGRPIRGIDIAYTEVGLSLIGISVANGDTSLVSCIAKTSLGEAGNFPLSFEKGGKDYKYGIYVQSVNGLSFSESVNKSFTGYLGDAGKGIEPGFQDGIFTVTKVDLDTKKISGRFSFTQESSPDVSPPLPTVSIANGVFNDISFRIE